MLTKLLIFLLTSFLLFSGLSAQVIFKDHKKYIEFVNISFNAEVVVSADSQIYYGLEDLRPEYILLKEAILKFNPIFLKKVVPWARWGDTLKVDRRGRVVHVQDMSQHFILQFSKPVLENEVLDSLRKLPEVRSVPGPTYQMEQ